MSYVDEIAQQIRNEVFPDDLPESDLDSLFLFYAVLCLTKGSDVSRRDVHDAWSAWMTLRGEEHEALIPFDDLRPDLRAEDAPFVAAMQVRVSIQPPTPFPSQRCSDSCRRVAGRQRGQRRIAQPSATWLLVAWPLISPLHSTAKVGLAIELGVLSGIGGSKRWH
jgi:hypothetical protein